MRIFVTWMKLNLMNDNHLWMKIGNMTSMTLKKDSTKQMKRIRHFHPCCEFHAYVALSCMSFIHVWWKFVHVLKVPSIISLISSKFYECHFHTCVPLFFNVQVSFICHKFIRVENFLSILSQKKIPKCCSFSFMWWTSSICAPFSCPLWVSFTIW